MLEETLIHCLCFLKEERTLHKKMAAARTMIALALTVCCLLNHIASRTCSTEAWIPTGHICRQRRIIFGQETFMVGKSKLQSTATNDNDAASSNPSPPPTLSFLDARYADLFRRTDGHGVTRPQPDKHQQGLLTRLRTILGIMSKDVAETDEEEHLLIRTHSRVRIGQRSSEEHTLNQSQQQKRRPIVRLDPATGLYITERSQPSSAVTKSEDAVAAAVTTDVKSRPSPVSPVASTSEAAQETPKSKLALTQDTEAAHQLQLAASTKDAAEYTAPSDTDADDLVMVAEGNPSELPLHMTTLSSSLLNSHRYWQLPILHPLPTITSRAAQSFRRPTWTILSRLKLRTTLL